MTKIYLIRHAEAEGNIYRRFHGHYNSMITRNGLRQIAALQKRFENVPVDACYASDLFRTRKTAEAIYLPKDLPLHTDKRLREICAGIWEDLTFGELETFKLEQMTYFRQKSPLWVVEGAENFDDIPERFFAALKQIAERHDGQSVCVVSHCCMLMRAERELLGGNEPPFCDNTAVTLLEYRNGEWKIDYLNDNSHLPESISTFSHQKWLHRGGVSFDFNLYYEPTGEGAWDAIQRGRCIGHVEVDLKTGLLRQLELIEEKRDMALGPQLLGQAISTLRRLGVYTISAELPEEHPAARFFADQGFFLTHEDGLLTVKKDIYVPGT